MNTTVSNREHYFNKNDMEKNTTPEERAREYGNKFGYSYETKQAISNGYLAGYESRNDEVSNLQYELSEIEHQNRNYENEVSQLRESFKRMVEKVNMLTYSIVEEEIKVNKHFFAETMDAISEAKELLTKTEKE